MVRNAAARSGEFAPWQWVCSSPFEFIPAKGAWSRKSTQDTLKTNVIDSWCFWLNSWASIVISCYFLELFVRSGMLNLTWLLLLLLLLLVLCISNLHHSYGWRAQCTCRTAAAMDNILNMMQAVLTAQTRTFVLFANECIRSYCLRPSFRCLPCGRQTCTNHRAGCKTARLQYVFCKGYMGAMKLAMLDEFSQCLGFKPLWHRTSAPFISLKLSRGSANCLGETRWHGVKLTQQEAARWSPLHPWEMWGWVNNDGTSWDIHQEIPNMVWYTSYEGADFFKISQPWCLGGNWWM